MIIYKTTNLINGKIYIGRDVSDDPSYFGSGLLIRRAISKYGLKNFIKEMIERCLSIEELNRQEKFWIEFYNSTDKSIGYNIMNGGQGGNCKNYRYGSRHPYFGKTRPAKIGIAVATANKTRLKKFGKNNGSYKDVTSEVKRLILKLSTDGLGRDKIYLYVKDEGLSCPSPRTITRRLKDWNNEYATS